MTDTARHKWTVITGLIPDSVEITADRLDYSAAGISFSVKVDENDPGRMRQVAFFATPAHAYPADSPA